MDIKYLIESHISRIHKKSQKSQENLKKIFNLS